METKKETGDSGVWYVAVIKPDGWVSKDMLPVAEAMRKMSEKHLLKAAQEVQALEAGPVMQEDESDIPV
jgi:hypothetical protein